MRVLIACEFSGIIREAFAKRGHDAWSCDFLDTEIPGNHIKDNVLFHLHENWDLMIAHPPCTYLAVSGARWFKNRQREQKEALQFVRDLMNADIPKICIENPVSVISTRIRKPDQIIQPWMFGESFQKTTCLWLKNLPKLKVTNIVEKGEFYYPKSGGRRRPKWFADAAFLPKEERQKIRSRTFLGIADAMATQWEGQS
jgi:hypothetical protein